MTVKERNKVTELLQKLVRIKSVNPPGNEDKIANFIKEYLLKNGILSELIPLEQGRSSLVARIPGKENSEIALCGHMDTVIVNKNKWKKPPFGGFIENGRMYGRGTADMKGGVATIIYSITLLKRKGIVPKKSILIALTADEEQKYRGAKSLVDNGYFNKTDFLVITEPTNLKVKIGEKGELWIRVKFFGRKAHGSTPEIGINAVDASVEFVHTLLKRYDTNFSETPFFGKTSLNVGKLNGGMQVNIVPDYAEIELDFRVISESDKEKAVNFVNETAGSIAKCSHTQFESTIFIYHPPIFNSPNSSYVSKFIKTAGVKNGEFVGYCTDGATIIPKKKIPFVIFGPGKIELAHQTDEYIELNSLYQSIDILLNFLSE